ncbi:MAG: transposase [Bacteroidales bacterium]|nr:transposase [Bacteroidales bacterium]
MSKILPKRKSPRAQWIEYNAGLYFITICTHNWVHYFGEIKFGKIYLTELGEYLDKTLQGASNHNNYINILQYVIMPNHLHAIVEVEYEEYSDRACSVPTMDERLVNKVKSPKIPLLSIFVRSLKSEITRYANIKNITFRWQNRYHDHLIRGVEDCNNISQYIENNVLNWEKDCFC